MFRVKNRSALIDCAFACAVALLLTSQAHADSDVDFTGPGWLSVTGTQLTPGEAEEYYQSTAPEIGQTLNTEQLESSAQQQSSAVVASAAGLSNSKEIIELARALNHDPLLIYKFVHDHIDYTPYYGLMKGATYTYLSGSGNDFDQAALLVALLRESGYSDVSFVHGYLTIPGEQLINWMGLDSSTVTVPADQLLDKILSNASIPFENIQSDGTVEIDRVWVKLTVNGNEYLLDPSFKQHTFLPAQFSLPASYDPNAFVSGATNGAVSAQYSSGASASSSITNLNISNIDNQLSDYVEETITSLQNSSSGMDADELLGGKKIISATDTSLPTALSFPTSSNFFTVGIQFWDEVPNSYRHFLTIEQDGLDYNEFEIYGYTKTIDLSSLSGRSLSIVYSNSVETSFIVAREGTVGTAPFGRDYLYSIKVTIYQDDIRDGRKVVGSFDSYTYTYPYTYLDKRTLNLKVTHPYPNINASDEEAIPYPVRRNATYAVVYGFGGADNRLVQQAQKELDRVIASDVQNDKDAVLGQSLHMMAQNWMQQSFLVDELAAKTVGALSIPYHRVGLMAQETGYYIDVKNAIGSTVRYRDVELSGITGSLAPTSEGHAIDILHRNAQFVVISAIEHGVLEQLMGSCNPGVSTMKVMELANAAGIPIHYVTSVSAFDNIKNSLAYTSSLETKMRNLLNSGGGLLLPNDGTIPSGSWNGNGYLYHSNNRISLAIGNGYNGGYASYLQPVSPPRINTVADFSFPEFSTSYELSTPKSLDPVDLSTGAFLYDHTDLSLVSPMPLSFSRSYSSENNNKESSAGHGWMHNHDIHLARHSSIGPVYGKRQYHEAVALVVSMRILSDLLERIAGINSDISANTTDAELWLIASLVANWAIDQTTDNAVTVHIGNKNLQYIKLPNGEYQPPPGVTTQLIYSGSDDPITCNGSNEVHNGIYSLVERFGTRYDFNSDDKLSKITDIDGNTVDYAYTGEKLNTVSNNFNQNLTFDYTGDNLFSVTDSSSRIVKFSYTPEGDLDIYTDPEGKTWDHDYDNHRMIRITDPTATVIVENTYDSLGRADTQKVPRSSTGQADQMEMYKFYISGFRNVEEDPEGNQTVYYLDQKGRTAAVENALGNTSYSEHDGQNQIVKNIDARANKTITEYDSNHNVRFITDALNNKSENVYDAQFRLKDVIDTLTHTTHFEYDAEHHLKLARDDLSNTTSSTYYPNGTQETSTDGRGVITHYNYDPQGNPDTTRVAAHPVIGYSYNTLGQLDSLTDQEGATTSFSYDDRGLVTKITDPLNKDTILKYDDAGRLDTVKDRNLKITDFDYTRSGKVELIDYASDPSVSFTYDVHDNRDSMTDALGQTHYDYDELQRLTSQTDPQGYTVGYDYDEMGNLKTLTYPDNKTVGYTYDELNRLKTVKVNWLSGTPTATYIYDDAGRLERLIQFNGSNTIYIYDNANRLTDLINIKSDGNIISRHQFPDIDGNGNRLKEVRDEPVVPTLATQTVQLNYNSPQKNRLISTSNDSFGYDTEGQQNNKSGTAYTFDDAHRLTKIGTSVEYFYDGAGNRLRDTRYGIVTRKFIYDASNNLLAQGINGEDIIVKYYIHGAGLLGMVQGSELYSYHYDATGNTLANTDLSQNIVNTYSYGAYGLIANESETIPQPFKYVGQYGVQYEVEHGLYYMRARYYDPEVGRFISEDPLGLEAGVNLYAYSGGNPIMFIDPSGLIVADTGDWLRGFGDGVGSAARGWYRAANQVGTAMSGVAGMQQVNNQGRVIGNAINYISTNQQDVLNIVDNITSTPYGSGRVTGRIAMGMLTSPVGGYAALLGDAHHSARAALQNGSGSNQAALIRDAIIGR